MLTIISTNSPGGEGGGGYRNPSREFMRVCDFGQLWGADFKNRCYTGNIGAFSLVLMHTASFWGTYIGKTLLVLVS